MRGTSFKSRQQKSHNVYSLSGFVSYICIHFDLGQHLVSRVSQRIQPSNSHKSGPFSLTQVIFVMNIIMYFIHFRNAIEIIKSIAYTYAMSHHSVCKSLILPSATKSGERLVFPLNLNLGDFRLPRQDFLFDDF